MISYNTIGDLRSYKAYLSNFGGTEKEDQIDWYNLSGLSSHNEYIPFYSLWNSVVTYLSKEKGDSIIQYSIPDVLLYDNNNLNKPARYYRDFYSGFKSRLMPKTFKTPSMKYSLHVMKGLVFEVVNNEPKIHVLLTIKKEYLTDILDKTGDYSKFALFLSHEFNMGAKFKSVHKKMYSELFAGPIRTGLDLIITDKIDKWCFNNSTPLPKFKTVDQMYKYYEELKKELVL